MNSGVRNQLDEVSVRLDRLESDAKKYNLVVRGLPQKKVLERSADLETEVENFIEGILNLTNVDFDEGVS